MARIVLGILGVLMVGALLAPRLAAQPASAKRQGGADPPNYSYSYRILNAPTSSDERAIRTLGLQPEAQRLSNRLYAGLAPLLGGSAPALNFVPTGSPLLSGGDSSANVQGQPGAPQGSINASPLTVEALINNASPYHNVGVLGVGHEDAHLHQVAAVLAQLLTREGGAQGFADLVVPSAAKQAGIPYRAPLSGTYNGSYEQLVRAVQQPPYGRDWLLFSQFGKPVGTWP